MRASRYDEPGELAPLHSGAFSSPSQAGNLGLPVWRHAACTWCHGPTAAAKAGLKQGDKIVRFNGIAATTLPSLWMPHYLNHAKAGERLHFTLADGKKLAITLVPDTMLQKALHPSRRI